MPSARQRRGDFLKVDSTTGYTGQESPTGSLPYNVGPGHGPCSKGPVSAF
jgi:hypothetical protein